MKKNKIFNLPFFGILICFSLLSCAGSNPSNVVVKLNFNRTAGKEPGGDFIKFKDGTKLTGKIDHYTVVLIRGIFNKKNHSVQMDGKDYPLNEIFSFQKDSVFFTRQNKSSKTFIERKMAGKINVFFVHYNDLVRNSKGETYRDIYDLHWLQKGIDGEIENFNMRNLEKMVSDNSTALDLLQDYKNAKRNKKDDSVLVALIELYNKS